MQNTLADSQVLVPLQTVVEQALPPPQVMVVPPQLPAPLQTSL
jgi:hypothetical protein